MSLQLHQQQNVQGLYPHRRKQNHKLIHTARFIIFRLLIAISTASGTKPPKIIRQNDYPSRPEQGGYIFYDAYLEGLFVSSFYIIADYIGHPAVTGLEVLVFYPYKKRIEKD